jgi:hypothetical protein
MFAILFCVLGALNMLAMREMGNLVHSSVKTFYFGVVSTILTAIFFLFYDPQLFAVWKYNQEGEYSFQGKKLLAGLIIGLFNWAVQESLSIALTIIKSGAVAAFLNVGLIFSFLVDVTYFDREAFWTDYIGTILIIVCTSFQGWIASQEYNEQE